MNIKYSLVIPCFNEGKNVATLFKKIDQILHVRHDIEIILVNNGSTDKSFENINHLDTNCKIVFIKKNIGYGHGIVTGLKASQGEYIGWTHADLQTDLNDFIKGIAFTKPNSFIKGRRMNRSLTDQFFTLGMSMFESIYFRNTLFDINAQPNIMPRSFFTKLNDFPDDFSLDLYIYVMAHKANLDVIRFPVAFPSRIHGKSKWNTSFLSKFKFIYRTLDFSFKLKKRLKCK